MELEGYIVICPSTDWWYCPLCWLYLPWCCCCRPEACGPVDVNRVASAGVRGIGVGVGIGMEDGVGIVGLCLLEMVDCCCVSTGFAVGGGWPYHYDRCSQNYPEYSLDSLVSLEQIMVPKMVLAISSALSIA